MILAVDEDREALERIEHELVRRYAADYEIMCSSDSKAALAVMTRLHDSGGELAIVLAAQWMTLVSGEELLGHVKHLHPRAKRALLIEWGGWGDKPTAEVVLRAMARGCMDYYVLKPWRSPDEYFHRTISEFLHEWSRTDPSSIREITIVARRWSPRAHELRDLLGRNGVPHVFCDSDSPGGRAVLERVGQPSTTTEPVVVTLDGRVLIDPSNSELARAYGVDTEVGPDSDFDVIVIGAGPAGLSATVYAASEGLRTLVVEGVNIGGQAGSSALIRNYLGFPRGVSGAELAQRAYQQAWVFGARFVLMRRVTALRTEGSHHVVTMSDGSEARARVVILAMGVSYRRLGISSIEALTGAGVFYGSSVTAAQALSGEDAYVIGGGNSAGQAVMHLSRFARRAHLIVRSASLSDTMSQYLIDEIAATSNVEISCNTTVVDGGGEGRLQWLAVHEKVSGETRTVPAAALFILIGARPHTDWLPATICRNEAAYVLTGADLPAERAGASITPPRMFESSVPGVFAIGDVRCGSVKRVASAVGEGPVVIQQVWAYLTGVPT